MAVPSLLYHYCSMESFWSIINSGVFRLSDSRCTNDASENFWITKPATDVLEEIEKSNEKYVLELGKYIQGIGMMPAPYIACFSEEGDLLSQWRAYADDGHGISIGFELNVPQGLPIMNTGEEALHHSLKMEKVVYDYDMQREFLKEVIDRALHDKFENIYLYGNQFKLLSYVYKHPAFSEEREWRIINTPVIDVNCVMAGGVSELKFRTTRDKLISFVEIPIAEGSIYATIREVVLGPKNKTFPDTLHGYLELKEYHNVKIRRSNAPYR